MVRLSKPAKSVIVTLSAALIVTACGAGNTADNRNSGNISYNRNNVKNQINELNGTDGSQVNQADGGILNRDGDRSGMLPGNGMRSPFPPNSVQPLGKIDWSSTGNHMLAQDNQAVLVPFVKGQDGEYVTADAIVQLLEYKNSKYDAETGTYQIGDNDVLVQLKADSTDAELAGYPVTLSAAPKLGAGGELLLPKEVVADLFQEDMVFDVTPEGIMVYPSDSQYLGQDQDGPEDVTVDEALDFGDDPTDPFAGPDDESEGVFLDESEELPSIKDADGAEAVPVLKNININALIRTSKRYLGVRYDFGAKPYPRSHRFDCSSYTQYVYGKYGIRLPRTARAQSRVGKTVSRKSLRKGDLLFFYVPGRFKSNKVVGHVGIYIGGGKMINANTAPRNGVQIRSINRAFYKKTFIRAKRVAY
ncbi:C40 family peptidase [Paenibacillus thermotolerans]|uniref:C40 family peptidase n=1 Tax=Paenibacillus thermotolerans TaxID=3027807 RepID=UPI002368B082|nr:MULTISPECIES: C40 family peptidase [unclassified Paenibacillus]